MSDLLTAKQVQELLQVNRTTIYRMLKDGRLSGVKVGHQWRFPIQQVEALLDGVPLRKSESQTAVNTLPIFCFQSMQDIFADIAQVGTVTITQDGIPLTKISHNCQFCELLLNSKTGYQACQNSWRKLIAPNQKQTPFTVCHAGLQYIQTPIKTNDTVVAMLIAGQFYTHSSPSSEVKTRIKQLAQDHRLDEKELADAAQDIMVLDGRQEMEIGSWLAKLAAAFEHMSLERANFMNRLQRIARMSDLENEPITLLANAGD